MSRRCRRRGTRWVASTVTVTDRPLLLDARRRSVSRVRAAADAHAGEAASSRREPSGASWARTLLDSTTRFRLSAFMETYLRASLAAGFQYLSPVLTSGSTVLDVGCATGDVTNALSSVGITCVGLDIDPAVLRQASLRSAAGATFVLGDMQRLPFPSCSFDAVISISALQYADWRRTVLECDRVLRPGGRALFIENLRGNPFAVGYRLHRRLLHPYPPFLKPVSHLQWSDRSHFSDVFYSVTLEARNLFTPLSYLAYSDPHLAPAHPPKTKTIGAGCFSALSWIDSRSLGRFAALEKLCWTITVMCTKAPAVASH